MDISNTKIPKSTKSSPAKTKRNNLWVTFVMIFQPWPWLWHSLVPAHVSNLPYITAGGAVRHTVPRSNAGLSKLRLAGRIRPHIPVHCRWTRPRHSSPADSPSRINSPRWTRQLACVWLMETALHRHFLYSKLTPAPHQRKEQLCGPQFVQFGFKFLLTGCCAAEEMCPLVLFQWNAVPD